MRSCFLAIVFLGSFTTQLVAADYTGRYVIHSNEGVMTLAIAHTSDGATGTLEMAGTVCSLIGETFTDEDGEVSIEGEMTCGAGGGEFEFSYDAEDETYYLFVTPYDQSGTPRLDFATLYAAVPAGDAEFDDSPPAAATNAIVGLWTTQVVMNTPQGGIATQLAMDIRADGTLVDLGSRSVGGIPGVHGDTGMQGGGEVAAWRTAGNILQVSYAGSQWLPLARFELSGDKMLLVYYDGDQKLWHRQR